jgi:hypothetical protein
MNDHTVSVLQEKQTFKVFAPHVVLLGAGASRAATEKSGDKNGKVLPLMRDLVSIGNIGSYFSADSGKDFETAYQEIKDPKAKEQIEKDLYNYFSSLKLPDYPTIYDHLVLSLRETDLIATFNWDPLLIQAYRRSEKAGFTSLPKLAFLHGNVLVGFCENDKTAGLIGSRCSKCGKTLTPSKLLYPEKKDYQSDPIILSQWKLLQNFLERAMMFTVFGYSAPVTDQEAISLMKQAWGEVSQREMEQVELIAQKGVDKEKLAESWNGFIHTHHYEVVEGFYDSWIANHSRRTIEAYFHQYIEAKWIDSNPVPQTNDWDELYDWYRDITQYEK